MSGSGSSGSSGPSGPSGSSGQYPSHQHSGNSHARIFGNFSNSEATPARGSSTGAVGGPAAPGRRRRWVRTRTQHLSSLSLEDDVIGDHPALAAPAAPALPPPADCTTYYDAPPSPPDAPAEPMSPAAVAGLGASPTCGRYAYRRPDGNPVTGEGYGHLENCELQAVIASKK